MPKWRTGAEIGHRGGLPQIERLGMVGDMSTKVDCSMRNGLYSEGTRCSWSNLKEEIKGLLNDSIVRGRGSGCD